MSQISDDTILDAFCDHGVTPDFKNQGFMFFGKRDDFYLAMKIIQAMISNHCRPIIPYSNGTKFWSIDGIGSVKVRNATSAVGTKIELEISRI